MEEKKMKTKIIVYSISGILGIIAIMSILTSFQEIETVNVDILPGSAMPDQEENISPKVIHVVIGKNNTIRWNNLDDSPRTLTPDHSYGGFPEQIGLLRPGESQEFTFEHPGVYNYHGVPGPWITGTIIVTEPKNWWE